MKDSPSNRAADRMSALSASKRKGTPSLAKKKKRLKPPAKKKGTETPRSTRGSSLWDLVPTSREAFVKRIPAPISTTALRRCAAHKAFPKDFQRSFPSMMEFYILMLERQCIFGKNKNATSSRVLRDYHFCNNYRELDRGTAFFRSQVLQLYFDAGDGGKRSHLQQDESNIFAQRVSSNGWTQLDWTEQVLAMSYYYRLCNRIDSFSHKDNPLIPLGNMIPRLGQFTDEFAAYVRSFKTRKEVFFTAAHQTTNYESYICWCQETNHKVDRGDDKVNRVGPSILRQLASEVLKATIANDGYDLQRACNVITKLKGVRNFFAWQIVCDLEESGCFGSKGKQCDDFCLLGPGAESGLTRIFGKKLVDRAPMQLCKFLRDNIDICLGLAGQSFPYWRGRPVTLKMIEHSLCEYDKFIRIDGGSRLRKRKSASHSDGRKCQRCRKTAGFPASKGSARCDSCHAMFCSNCAGDDKKEKGCNEIHKNKLYAFNYCSRCHIIDTLEFH